MDVVGGRGLPPSFDGVTGLRAGMAGRGRGLRQRELTSTVQVEGNATFHWGQLDPSVADG